MKLCSAKGDLFGTSYLFFSRISHALNVMFELLLGDLQSLQATHSRSLAVDGELWYLQGIHSKSN